MERLPKLVFLVYMYHLKVLTSEPDKETQISAGGLSDPQAETGLDL